MTPDDLRSSSGPLKGTPQRGLFTATLAFFVGLTTIVLYGAAGPTFAQRLRLSGTELGILLASPHLTKALLRIPFGASVDAVGGRRPFLVLLVSSALGLLGIFVTLALYYPNDLGRAHYPLFLFFGVLGGAGGATFSVGAPQTSFWFPRNKQGWDLGVYGGIGNIGAGLFNVLVPLLVGFLGLTWAYGIWTLLFGVAIVTYGSLAVDPYYFQLRSRGHSPAEATRIASEHGQEVFPTGKALSSLARAVASPRIWVLVFLYSASFGGGFTALTTWFPTYFHEFHGLSLIGSGALAATFTVLGSILRAPGGSLSDRFGGESTTVVGFLAMGIGGGVLSISLTPFPAVVGMTILAIGMALANAAIFKLVPLYAPRAIGGASGLIGGIGGMGTLLVLPLLGELTDRLGRTGFVRGFLVYAIIGPVGSVAASLLRKRAP